MGLSAYPIIEYFHLNNEREEPKKRATTELNTPHTVYLHFYLTVNLQGSTAYLHHMFIYCMWHHLVVLWSDLSVHEFGLTNHNQYLIKSLFSRRGEGLGGAEVGWGGGTQQSSVWVGWRKYTLNHFTPSCSQWNHDSKLLVGGLWLPFPPVPWPPGLL